MDSNTCIPFEHLFSFIDKLGPNGSLQIEATKELYSLYRIAVSIKTVIYYVIMSLHNCFANFIGFDDEWLLFLEILIETPCDSRCMQRFR